MDITKLTNDELIQLMEDITNELKYRENKVESTTRGAGNYDKEIHKFKVVKGKYEDSIQYLGDDELLKELADAFSLVMYNNEVTREMVRKLEKRSFFNFFKSRNK